MKKFSICSLMLFALVAFAQTSVVYNASLYAVGTEYTNRVIKDASFNPGPAGSGSWNFTSYTGGTTSTFTSIAYDPTIPHIGECAVPPNFILYYHNVTDTSDAEGWGFSKVDPGYVDFLGLYGTLVSGGSTYRLSAFYSTYTHAHTFPINFGDSWVESASGGGSIYAFGFTINYSLQDTNRYRVDGYGTIVLPTGTFQALRIKKRSWRHSRSTHILFGFNKTERRVSYLWYCTELGNAVTFAGPIDSTGGQPDSTFTTGELTMQIANSSLDILESPFEPTEIGFSTYPNPFNSSVRISIPNVETRHASSPNIEIFDVNGRRVQGEIFDINGLSVVERSRNNREYIWTPDEKLGSGIYLIRATVGGKTIEKRAVYLK